MEMRSILELVCVDENRFNSNQLFARQR